MTLSRRDFLHLVGLGSLGGSGALGALGALGGAAGCDDEAPLEVPLECEGAILGEPAFAGHALRDGLALAPRGGPVEADEPLRDAVIVGAGLSGLAAAWALIRGGCDDLVVLERGADVGGVALGGHLEGYPCPWGAHYLGLPDPDSPVLMHLLTDLGVVIDFTADGRPVVDPAFRVRPPVVNLYHGRTVSYGFFPWGIASARDTAQYRAFLADMARWSRWRDPRGLPAFQLPVAYGSTAEEVQALDRISLADYLAARGWDSPLLRWTVDNRMTDEYGCRADEISAYAALLFWAAEGGVQKAAPTREALPDLVSFPEGNAFLARRLRDLLPPGALRLGAFVTDVRHHEDEVRVTTWDPLTGLTHVYRGRTCLFAAPKLRADLVVPELARAGRAEHLRLTYSPWLVANLLIRRMPEHAAPRLAWDNLVHGSWSLGFVHNGHLTEPGRDPQENFVATFYACFSGATREGARRDLLGLDWSTWARLIANELERVAPKIRDEIARLDLWRWGHAMVRPAPGSLFGGLRDALSAPLGRIYFAGNDAGVLPLYEEAVYRGVQAADAALDRLGRPHASLLGRRRDPGSPDRPL